MSEKPPNMDDLESCMALLGEAMVQAYTAFGNGIEAAFTDIPDDVLDALVELAGLEQS